MLSLVLMAVLNKGDLVDKIVNAYGGAAAWEKVESFHETGSVVSKMRSDKGELDRVWQRPDKLRVEIRYPRKTEVRDLLGGGRGTTNGEPADGMMLDAMRLQQARLSLPLLLVQKRAALKIVDSNHIEVPLDNGMTLTVETDGSGRIIKTTGKATGIEFSTTYSDFRTVDGLVFAFREENTAQGMPTGDNEISKVDVHLGK
jgi:hypothetical protein